MNETKVQDIIFRIESLLAELKSEVDKNPKINIRVNNPATIRVGNDHITVAPPRPSIVGSYNPIDLSLIDGHSWPEAISSDLLCDKDDEEEKIIRAEAIFDMTVETNIEDKRFLDYGCAEGYMVQSACDRNASLAVGYDINPSQFKAIQNLRLKLTSNRNDLENKGYDVILAHDVVDHADDPSEVIRHIASLLSPGGTVHMVCHPWVGRHGGHLYRKFNKAYAHLWFDYPDLKARGLLGEQVSQIITPRKKYKEWFESAGLIVKAEDVIYSDSAIEDYLRTPEVWKHLTRHFDDERKKNHFLDDNAIAKILEIDYINYTLQSGEII